MNKLKITIGIVLIFVLGLLIGALGSGMYFKNRIDHFRDADRMGRKEILIKRLTERLDLTAKQQDEIAIILDEMRGLHDALREKHRPEIEQIRIQSNERIKAILNDDQKKQFDEMIEELQKRRHELVRPFRSGERRDRGKPGKPPPF